MQLLKKNLVMDNFLDLIHVYEGILEENICSFLINLYEEQSDKHERVENEGKPNFTQFNLTENCRISDEVNNVHNFLIKKTIEIKTIYYEFVDSRVFPADNAFEQFRIKKYIPGGTDRFDTHVDVKDYQSARRFLSFMWYLNDVPEGGKTIFKDLEITPKTGSLLVFPPLWMFPHRGEPPISNPKYVLNTYLHYK